MEAIPQGGGDGMISDELFDALYEHANPDVGGTITIELRDPWAADGLWDRLRFRNALAVLLKQEDAA